MQCKSQLLAGALLTSGGLISWVIQPYLEVFVRWNNAKKCHEKEASPPVRVSTLAKSVFEKMCIPVEIHKKIDFFLTNDAEAIALGSLRNADACYYADYAFIGLPFFCAYEKPEDIPLEGLYFGSPLFPFTVFSDYGIRRLELMCISDAALEFLIARELASLLGSSKLSEYLKKSPNLNENVGVFLSPRLNSRVSTLSLIGSLYAAYQLCFGLNRLLKLRSAVSRSTRGLIYACVTATLLLCQRQLLVAWRHHCALALDAAVANCHPSLRAGGVEYYAWKSDWNAFWTQKILPSSRKAMAVLGKVARGSLLGTFDRLPSPLQYQAQWALVDSDLNNGYYIPASVMQCFSKKYDSLHPRLDDCSPFYLSEYRLPRYDANTRKGDEKFASDGDTLRFNMTGLLALGAMPKWLSFLMEPLSFPATCSQRKAALEKSFCTPR